MFGYVPPRSTEQGIKHFTTLRYGHKPKFGKPSKRGGLFTEKKKKHHSHHAGAVGHGQGRSRAIIAEHSATRSCHISNEANEKQARGRGYEPTLKGAVSKVAPAALPIDRDPRDFPRRRVRTTLFDSSDCQEGAPGFPSNGNPTLWQSRFLFHFSDRCRGVCLQGFLFSPLAMQVVAYDVPARWILH